MLTPFISVGATVALCPFLPFVGLLCTSDCLEASTSTIYADISMVQEALVQLGTHFHGLSWCCACTGVDHDCGARLWRAEIPA